MCYKPSLKGKMKARVVQVSLDTISLAGRVDSSKWRQHWLCRSLVVAHLLISPRVDVALVRKAALDALLDHRIARSSRPKSEHNFFIMLSIGAEIRVSDVQADTKSLDSLIRPEFYSCPFSILSSSAFAHWSTCLLCAASSTCIVS